MLYIKVIVAVRTAKSHHGYGWVFIQYVVCMCVKYIFGDIYVCKQCIMNGNCSFSLSLSLNCPLWLSKAEHSMWALNTHTQTQTHTRSSQQLFFHFFHQYKVYHTHIHIRSNQHVVGVFSLLFLFGARDLVRKFIFFYLFVVPVFLSFYWHHFSTRSLSIFFYLFRFLLLL